MRRAILADIHGNLEALQAVTAELEARNVDQVICLGDNVGYGPDPEAVADHLRRCRFRSVLGNHEFALFDQRGKNWLNFQAAENCEASYRMLSKENRAFLQRLPTTLRVGKAHLVHGFPPGSLFLYLNKQKDERLRRLFQYNEPELYFVGHTHRLDQVELRGDELLRTVPPEGTMQLRPGSRYIVGCGSVGQPRDGDGRAVFLVWDDEKNTLEIHRCRYDYETTRKKIQLLGFPEIYGKRLGGDWACEK